MLTIYFIIISSESILFLHTVRKGQEWFWFKVNIHGLFRVYSLKPGCKWIYTENYVHIFFESESQRYIYGISLSLSNSETQHTAHSWFNLIEIPWDHVMVHAWGSLMVRVRLLRPNYCIALKLSYGTSLRLIHWISLRPSSDPETHPYPKYCETYLRQPDGTFF
jgi:hypothetical protein